MPDSKQPEEEEAWRVRLAALDLIGSLIGEPDRIERATRHISDLELAVGCWKAAVASWKAHDACQPAEREREPQVGELSGTASITLNCTGDLTNGAPVESVLQPLARNGASVRRGALAVIALQGPMGAAEVARQMSKCGWLWGKSAPSNAVRTALWNAKREGLLEQTSEEEGYEFVNREDQALYWTTEVHPKPR